MDTIDYAIINVLKENGRASASEISKTVNLSIPAVTERIRKLERAEIIQQYTIKINRRKIEQRLLAFIFVNIDKTENINSFRNAIVQHNCVLECHHIAGMYDYLLKVVMEDTQALEYFLSNTLKTIKGVSDSNTIITLTTLKEELNS
ncbi:Lrp/AsnC family leucine-responsive transcriptional regulator [Kineothrix alysoides]|jgi:Lrp/AsnC family leucine-responsive transcriptional regulator|uniref:Lrp/AsnC family leucine-responsive transcriptional regulator n=1 Tax=Kineothrix alysoides TaxID=1469948 RepID=A0A4R1R4J7_9FIRM|nr:Lrp/AsnC family transcriptional regulator [Kineothrix alysoides]TCL60403.1 Lrp/AsnC family leucine-responsive transcriptional regulator [Kineothrix alysoides]